MKPLKEEFCAQLRAEGGELSLALLKRLEPMTRREWRAWLRVQRKAATVKR